MNGTAYGLAADAVLALHLVFVLFVVGGSFLAWKWRGIVWAHVPALLWGLWVELAGQICPLTPLENRLRRLAGQQGYEGGFIEHYLVPLLYPAGLTRGTQWLLASLLVAINAVGYYGLWRRGAVGRRATASARRGAIAPRARV